MHKNCFSTVLYTLNLLFSVIGYSVFGQTKLNNQLTGDNEVLTFRINNDGSKVVYSISDKLTRSFELYSVPVEGGISTSLAPIQNNFGIKTIKLSPTGAQVLYTADHASIGKSELYVNSIDGGNLIKLNNDSFSSIEDDFEVSSDNKYVVYRAEQDFKFITELYLVSIDGGAVTKLNGVITSGGDVINFQINFDSTYAVYLADQNANDTFELYSTNIETGENSTLSVPIVNDTDEVLDYAISPGNDQVIYRMRSNGIVQLYSVPIQGGMSTRLNGDLVAGGNVLEFLITPNGSKVIYKADEDRNTVFELYSVDVSGENRIKLNSFFASDRDIDSFKINPNGLNVVYKSDQNRNSVREIFVVSVNGGTPIKLNADFPFGSGFVNSYEFSPDGNKVVYHGINQETLNARELYSVSINGENLQKLNPTVPEGHEGIGVSNDFEISDDSTKVIYCSDIEGVRRELYVVDIEGGSSLKLNGDLVVGGFVLDKKMSADNINVIYSAEQDTDNVSELYSTALTVLSVDEVDSKKMAISPNPTSDIAKVFGIQEIDKITVYDIYGNKVLDTYNENIDLTKVSTGLYMVTILNKNGNFFSEKILKK